MPRWGWGFVMHGGTAALGVYSNTFAQNGSALELHHTLTELQLQPGKTLTLTGDVTAPAGGDELHALISGAGNLQIDAANAITLNTQETFTGSTLIVSGTLKAGTANVVASSTAFANDSVFALNNFDQLINNLTGSGTIIIEAVRQIINIA